MLVPGLASGAECVARRADAPEILGLAEMFDAMAATLVGSPNDAPEVNNAAMNEEGPQGVSRLAVWQRDRRWMALAEVRFAKGGPAAEVLRPEGALVAPIADWPCLLAPGDQVNVSDGFTDHSTLLHAIDLERRRVSFVDPRAHEVFLLSENSLFDDLGGRWWDEDGRRLFSVPFETMDRTLREALLPIGRSFSHSGETVRALYPEIPPDDVCYWEVALFLTTLDPANTAAEPLEASFRHCGDIDAASLRVEYMLALDALQATQPGERAALSPDFGGWAGLFVSNLSAEMNFRLLHELLLAGENEWVSDYAVAYLDWRAPDLDLDIAIAGAIGCALAGRDCAAGLIELSQREFERRLETMYRGETLARKREMLHWDNYLNTTILLMRARERALADAREVMP